jgi:hypothetical protein
MPGLNMFLKQHQQTIFEIKPQTEMAAWLSW